MWLRTGVNMANSLLTIDMITREAIMLFRNSNAFIQNLDRQYDDQFANDGAKIGYNLRIRLPNDYVVRTGAAMSVQDTSEQSTPLVVSTQKGVDVSFSTQERTMSLDDYSERVLQPMINDLAGNVAASLWTSRRGAAMRSDGAVRQPPRRVRRRRRTRLPARGHRALARVRVRISGRSIRPPTTR